MRFEEIVIPAFGPFRDFELSLPKEKYDVHLIYGPNEAGKSSLLRALRGLLYGIPAKTPDNHTHENKALRIGATISEGERTLFFQRRKGNRNTLLDEKAETLPETVLKEFTGAVTPNFFENMFGLDGESLRAGARRLLDGDGDLGTTLFSASLGGSPVDDAIKRLETEAAALWKDRARVGVSIPVARQEYERAKKAAREKSVSATAWQKLKREVADALTRFEACDQEFRDHRLRSLFVTNALQAKPLAITWQELSERLAGITLPALPKDFGQQVKAARETLTENEQNLVLLQKEKDRLNRELTALNTHEAVLAHEEEWEWLADQSGSHRERKTILPNLTRSWEEARTSKAGELEDFPELATEDLAQAEAQAATLTELEEQKRELKNEADQITRQTAILKAERQSLDPTRDGDDCETLAARAEELAAERKSITEAQTRLVSLTEEQERLQKELVLTTAIQDVSIPSAAELRAEEEARLTHEAAVTAEKKTLREIQTELETERAQLAHLETQGAIFSEADLTAARHQRDELVRKGGETKELTEAIASADEIVDVLRSRAEQVARAAGHQERIRILERRVAASEKSLCDTCMAYEAWQSRWEEHFAQQPGQSPLALLAWREKWEHLVELSERSRPLQQALNQWEEAAAQLVRDVGTSDFLKAHQMLRAQLKQENERRGELASLTKQEARLIAEQAHNELEREKLATELATQRERWLQLCERLGVSGESPAVGLAALKERQEKRAAILEEARLAAQLSQSQQAIKEFETRLHHLTSQLKLEAKEKTLRDCFDRARADQVRARELWSQLQNIADAEPERFDACEMAKAALMDLQKRAQTDDLDLALALLEERSQLELRTAELRETLNRLAAGRSLNDYLDELAVIDASSLEVEVADLSSRESHLQLARDEARSRWEQLRKEERTWATASDEAAAENQAAADALSRMTEDARRYRQLQHAIVLLKRQVEIYREKTQGPMMARTSEIFRTLTSGSFARVAAQLDDKDQPQLLAVRPDGREVPRTGLSEGTADQLYLALRLAAIDLHLENHPPMPLILDDLLMTFDDERVCALIPLLQEMSARTQILIFTHHEHLCDLLATETIVHRLNVQK